MSQQSSTSIDAPEYNVGVRFMAPISSGEYIEAELVSYDETSGVAILKDDDGEIWKGEAWKLEDVV